MTDTIPDHVGREAVRLLNEEQPLDKWHWPDDRYVKPVRVIAKLLMNPPAPMTDPDEEAAKRVLLASFTPREEVIYNLKAATEQMRKEREMWEAGR